MDKCRNCGAKIVKFPLWEGEGENRKFLWKNLFKMDIYSIILFVIVIGMFFGYKADIAKCDEVMEQPCEFCRKSNCCDYLAKENMYNISTIDSDLIYVGINSTT